MATTAAASSEALRAIHIRFTREAQAAQPRSMVAIEQPAEIGSLLGKPWPETFDDLYVILPSAPVPLEVRNTIERWLAAPDRPGTPPPVVVQMDEGTIRWRPGRAVVEGAVDVCENLVAALVDFSFFEGELRRLERDLLPCEASAAGDIAFAYQIRHADRIQWKRLGQTLESL